MSDGMGREPTYLSSHATNRYFIPNWGTRLLITEASDKLRLKYPLLPTPSPYPTMRLVALSPNLFTSSLWIMIL